MNVVYHFDMDGVLCDWVDMYNRRSDIPLDEFNALSRAEREVLKAEFFDYEFFRNLNPIEEGVMLLRGAIEAGRRVQIVSATGRVNREDVMRAKLDWVAEHIGDVDVLFVDKVEQKFVHMIDDCVNVLIDDRAVAIEAWQANGGVGLLFPV